MNLDIGKAYSKKYQDFVIFSVKFGFTPRYIQELSQVSQEIFRKKQSIHPLEKPKAGSYFKNPIIKKDFLSEEIPNSVVWPINKARVKIAAAWLIEACGLKDFKSGKVEVSKKHSLFFINLGGGKSSDFIKLMEVVKESVFSKFGVILDPEVEFLSF